ncbi:MAG: ParB/RepB/Spo0J family partition protein [Clostridia bacterium]|nr:ParB/RepB/Spo0J family partition protein [Clostridia bacterium]
MIPAEKIHPFEGNPFKVTDNDEMNELIQSITENGILEPLTVRPMENTDGEYEIIAGHRRFRAAQKAGLTEVPAFIRAVNRDEAAVMLVDSNLHRERILPSEKAFAYKLKAEALNHQGKRWDLTSGQIVPKPDDCRSTAIIGEQTGDSYKTVQRFIRLTNLIPELLDMMDEGKIAFSVGVELSFLDDQLQYDVLNACEVNDNTPSYAQAVRMHKAYNADALDSDGINAVMSEEKANQRVKISFNADDLAKYFPRQFTPKDIQDAIMRLVQQDYERKIRQRNDAR